MHRVTQTPGTESNTVLYCNNYVVIYAHRMANEVELRENVAYHSTLTTTKATATPYYAYEEVITLNTNTNKEKEPVYDQVLTKDSTVPLTTPAEVHLYEEPL